MPHRVEPLAPSAIRLRRDARLLLVLRVVVALSAIGVLAAVPGLFVATSQHWLVVVNVAILIVLFLAYLLAYRVATRGDHDRARSMLFVTWIGYLGAQLLLVRPDPGMPMSAMVVVGIGHAFAAMVLMGVLALDTGQDALRWMVGALVAYAAVMLIDASALRTAQEAWLFLTMAGTSGLLFGAAALFARAFASDLYGSLSQSDVALRSAREANEAKSNFLATMSHELRTPLTGILGMLELLREEADEHGQPSLVADLEQIWRAADHLHGVIGQVLDLSKIEAGKLAVESMPTRLTPLLDQIVATSQPLVERRDNVFDVVIADLPPELRTDPGRLRQILLNLLSNASKFTERGRIAVEVRGVGDRVQFVVRDTGMGIAPEHLARLFEPYEQADGSTARRFGGTGLGLAISHRLVGLLGGELQVASELGRGTTFSFELPVEGTSRSASGGPATGSR